MHTCVAGSPNLWSCDPGPTTSGVIGAVPRGASRARVRSPRVDLDLVFLGTSGSAPTARRSPPALLVRRGGERLLFDCGEGTQRQLLRSTVGLVDLREIFLTHFHADHYLGLPGMLKTFALRDRDVPLTIYGPPGLRDLFDDAPPHLRPAPVPARARRAARRARRSSATATSCSSSRSRTACRPSATRSSRTSGRAASTSRRPTRSACRTGRSAGRSSAASRSRSPTGATLTPDAVARAAARAGARSSIPATPRRARSSARWPRAPTCSSTRRRSATTRSTAPPTRRTRPRGRRPSSRATRACGCSR